MIYYTFRLISQTPIKVECCKWDDSSITPLETYVVYPLTHSCSCYAMKRECKHVILSKAMLTPEFVNEMHRWKWDEKNSWSETFDMVDMEDILESVS